MKNWTELENSSFFDANARERALGMVDKGTFTEFLNPLDRYCSPHLPVLGTAVEFDDGTVCGVGLLGKHPVFVVSMEGKFIGGAIGEVNGGKMVATIRLALKAAADIKTKYPEEYAARRPLVAVSFEIRRRTSARSQCRTSGPCRSNGCLPGLPRYRSGSSGSWQ